MDRRGQQSQGYTAWRKSSYSGGTEHGNCVEVAMGSGTVALRDSKNAAGPILRFGASDWRVFLGSR
jgi:hypothetical protein